jgi:GTP cyclohydrolase I
MASSKKARAKRSPHVPVRINREKIARGVRLILDGIGEDPDRPGLKHTPERVAQMYHEVFGGMEIDAHEIVRPLSADRHDEIVLVRDIPFYSMCEHHLLPFMGKAHVAYIPAKRIAGLSKLARLVETLSRRPQVQERLASEVADHIMIALNPKGVMVVMEAEHLCMTMRGVKKPGSVTVTSVVRGLFRKNVATRSEALSLIYHR